MPRNAAILLVVLLLSVSSLATPQRRGRFVDRDVIPDGSRVQYLTFTSDILNRELGYALYLPPSYEDTSDDYPVLFFLHGANENERRWSTRGFTDIELDRMVLAGEIGEFIVAIPFGENSFYTNSTSGERWEDMVIDEFIPMIESSTRAIGTRAGRAISGISMGGYGALKIAMRYPETFNAVSAHSAMLIDNFDNVSVNPRAEQLYALLFDRIFGLSDGMDHWESNNPLRIASESEGIDSLRIYFDCGTEDEYGFFVGAEQLHQILDMRGIAHEFQLYPGTHGWDDARQRTPTSLKFHWAVFNQ